MNIKFYGIKKVGDVFVLTNDDLESKASWPSHQDALNALVADRKVLRKSIDDGEPNYYSDNSTIAWSKTLMSRDEINEKREKREELLKTRIKAIDFMDTVHLENENLINELAIYIKKLNQQIWGI